MLHNVLERELDSMWPASKITKWQFQYDSNNVLLPIRSTQERSCFRKTDWFLISFLLVRRDECWNSNVQILYLNLKENTLYRLKSIFCFKLEKISSYEVDTKLNQRKGFKNKKEQEVKQVFFFSDKGKLGI